MTVKKKVAATAQVNEELDEDTASGHVDTSALDGMSKTNAMSVVMKGMAAADPGKWEEMMNAVLAQVGQYSKGVPDGAAAKNAASTAAKGTIAKAVKEDLEKLFGGDETLSEDFKEKASTLFESAVNARLAIFETELQEAYEMALEEELEVMQEALAERIDSFLSAAVLDWAEDNIVAIERSVSHDLAESFIVGLGKLYNEHNFNIPEDKVEVVDMLASKVDELEEELNKALVRNIEVEARNEELTKSNIINVMSEGLTEIEADKFKTLVEGFDVDDVDGYVKKLETIKNHHFGKSTPKAKTQLISEEIEYDDEEKAVASTVEKTDDDDVSPAMKRYLEAMRQTRENA